MVQLKRKDILYYARIHPKVKLFEVCELVVNTVQPSYFVAVDKKDKHSYLFSYDDIDNILFADRDIALQKVLDAESKAPKDNYEISYEEY